MRTKWELNQGFQEAAGTIFLTGCQFGFFEAADRQTKVEGRPHKDRHDPAAEVIRLWPDGPPTTLEVVGPEAEYRAPRSIGDIIPMETIRDAREAMGRRSRIGMIGFSAGTLLVVDVALDRRFAFL